MWFFVKKNVSVFVLIHALVLSLHAQTPEEIVGNFIKATGGIEKWRSLNTLQTDLKILAASGLISLDGRFSASASLKSIRLDVKIFGKWYSQVATPKGIEGRILGIFNFFSADNYRIPKETIVPPFIDADKNQTKLKLDGEVKINDENCYRVKVYPIDGRVFDFYFSKTTFLVLREVEKRENLTNQTSYSKYELTPYGIKIAMKKTLFENDVEKVTFENLNVVYNTLTEKDFILSE